MAGGTQQVEALIFDMDGTMIDSMPWHAKSWVEFARRRGLTLDATDILARTFLEAARRIGVHPAHCIVFEDAPFGIEAARRGGMRAVAACSSHSAAEMAGPHVIAAVRDYDEHSHSDFLETLDVVAAA